MSQVLARFEAVTAAAGALLELQEVIEACCEQTQPKEGVWSEDEETGEIWVHEGEAQQFLAGFDLTEVLKQLQQARGLISEAEFKLRIYPLETQF